MVESETGRKTCNIVRAPKVFGNGEVDKSEHFGSKNRAMSQCSGQRCNVSGQHRDVPESLNFNVATFGLTSQRDREACFSTSQRDRKVEFQRRDVIKRHIFNVAMLKANVATLQRG